MVAFSPHIWNGWFETGFSFDSTVINPSIENCNILKTLGSTHFQITEKSLKKNIPEKQVSLSNDFSMYIKRVLCLWLSTKGFSLELLELTENEKSTKRAICDSSYHLLYGSINTRSIDFLLWSVLCRKRRRIALK